MVDPNLQIRAGGGRGGGHLDPVIRGWYSLPKIFFRP